MFNNKINEKDATIILVELVAHFNHIIRRIKFVFAFLTTTSQFSVRFLTMPTECEEANPLQRDLADSIILMVPLDDIRILLACGAKVNEPVTQGLRALHYAVWQKHTEAVRLLLVRGADINATDDCGYSALHLAAEHGYYELTQLLLDAGAKVDYRQPTDELYPRTTLCDEPLRLALKNRHYV